MWLDDSASTRLSISDVREFLLFARDGAAESAERTSGDRDDSGVESVIRPLLEPSVVRGSRNEKRLPFPKAESTRS